MIHEKRHNLLDHGFRQLEHSQREASNLLAFVALALFIGAGAIWLQIFINISE